MARTEITRRKYRRDGTALCKQHHGCRMGVIEPHMPPLAKREGSVLVTEADNRQFVEAVQYRYRTGMPWRDLPKRSGDGTKVHLRFSRWAKSGVWDRIFQHLAADADNEYAR